MEYLFFSVKVVKFVFEVMSCVLEGLRVFLEVFIGRMRDYVIVCMLDI